jgi:hypothetical protein
LAYNNTFDQGVHYDVIHFFTLEGIQEEKSGSYLRNYVYDFISLMEIRAKKNADIVPVNLQRC